LLEPIDTFTNLICLSECNHKFVITYSAVLVGGILHSTVDHKKSQLIFIYNFVKNQPILKLFSPLDLTRAQQ